MKNYKLALGMLLFLSVVFFSHNASAAFSVKLCTSWNANYVDAGYGEDFVTPTGAYDWPARYSHALLEKKVGSDYVTVWSGILGMSGCTPDIELDSNTKYRFLQGTKLERADGRKIFVQPGLLLVPGFDDNWAWLANDFETYNLLAGTDKWYFNPSWNSPQTRVTVVASRVLGYYNKLEYPEYAETYVNTNPAFCTSSYSNYDTSGICIATDYLYNDTSLDHSTYKFVIGHEFGHRQADATKGPAGHFLYLHGAGPYFTEYTTAYEDPCNCVHSGDNVCLQARTYIGTAQVEAWAHFYGAALFNKRETDCHMGFWARAYVYDAYGIPYLDETPPVHFNCAANPKWMENECGTWSNRGTMLDWLNFYWNVWANGSHRFSVDEISNVWEDLVPIKGYVTQIPPPHDYRPIGWAWVDLVATVNTQYPFDLAKRNQFMNKGDAAGVDY